jgi:hypothetical protein
MLAMLVDVSRADDESERHGHCLFSVRAFMIEGVESLLAGDEIAARVAPPCDLRRVGVFLCARDATRTPKERSLSHDV